MLSHVVCTNGFTSNSKVKLRFHLEVYFMCTGAFAFLSENFWDFNTRTGKESTLFIGTRLFFNFPSRVELIMYCFRIVRNVNVSGLLCLLDYIKSVKVLQILTSSTHTHSSSYNWNNLNWSIFVVVKLLADLYRFTSWYDCLGSDSRLCSETETKDFQQGKFH